MSKPLELCTRALASLQPEQQLDILTQLFINASELPVEVDFLQLACRAMQNFKRHERSNLIYQLSRCAGTTLADGSDSLLPLKRMPTGLIEYVLQFFNAENVTQVCNSCMCVHTCTCMYLVCMSKVIHVD